MREFIRSLISGVDRSGAMNNLLCKLDEVMDFQFRDAISKSIDAVCTRRLEGCEGRWM